MTENDNDETLAAIRRIMDRWSGAFDGPPEQQMEALDALFALSQALERLRAIVPEEKWPALRQELLGG